MPIRRSRNAKRLPVTLVMLALWQFLFTFGYAQAAGSTVSGGQIIDTGAYTVVVPSSGEWQLQQDSGRGIVTMKEDPADGWFTVISVMPGTWKPGAGNPNEDELAEHLFKEEERNMTERGASRQYAPRHVFHAPPTVVDGKRLHLMYYTIAQRAHIALTKESEIDINYAMYLYMPPEFAQTRVFYVFIIGCVSKIGDTSRAIDLARIMPVIESFRIK